MVKTCISCNETKDDECFTFRKDWNKRINKCKPCIRNYLNKYKRDRHSGKRRLVAHVNRARDGKKTCIKCNETKPVSEFPKRKDSIDGYRNSCIQCRKSYQLNYQRTVYYDVKNKRIKEDVLYRLIQRHRLYVYKAVSFRKDKSSIKYLGCSVKNLKKWLEFQFTSEMSWNNYGSYWNIDHIIPLNMIENNKDGIIIFNWKNMQPMVCESNFSKGNTFSAFYIFNSIVSLNRFIKTTDINRNKEYQGIVETLYWLREKLRYGKNLSDDTSTKVLMKWAIRSQAPKLATLEQGEGSTTK